MEGSTLRRKEEHVGGKPVGGVVRAGHAGVDGAEIGAERFAADDRLDVMGGIAGNIGTDDGELVGQGRKLGERGAEGDARQTGGRFAYGAANLCRGRHFRVERLKLAGAAVQKQKNDRLVSKETSLIGGAGGEQSRQSEAAKSEAADLEEGAAMGATAVVDCQHLAILWRSDGLIGGKVYSNTNEAHGQPSAGAEMTYCDSWSPQRRKGVPFGTFSI